jgi:Tol biopolymer transport system component
VSDRDGNREIYTMNVDGSGTPTRLTFNNGGAKSPNWSPDGTKIAYWSDLMSGNNAEIYTMNATDGSGKKNLTKHPGQDQKPAWSPDGKSIVFERYANGNHEVYTMNANGTGQTNRSNAPDAIDGDSDWQPPSRSFHQCCRKAGRRSKSRHTSR